MSTQPNRWLLHGMVAAVGATVTVAAQVAGTVMGMASLLAVPLAGVVAAILVPAWSGWAALALGLALPVVVLAAGVGFDGLWPLALVLLAMPATAGWFAGLALVRARSLGIRAALRDPRVVGALAAAVGVAALLVWVMAELSSNPA